MISKAVSIYKKKRNIEIVPLNRTDNREIFLLWAQGTRRNCQHFNLKGCLRREYGCWGRKKEHMPRRDGPIGENCTLPIGWHKGVNGYTCVRLSSPTALTFQLLSKHDKIFIEPSRFFAFLQLFPPLKSVKKIFFPQQSTCSWKERHPLVRKRSGE